MEGRGMEGRWSDRRKVDGWIEDGGMKGRLRYGRKVEGWQEGREIEKR